MRNRRARREAGMTLVELVVSCAILMLLSTAALPIARWTVYRERERVLRRDLLEMRQAIDRYKDLADRGQIRVDQTTGGYPPDLETLVKGVPLVSTTGAQGKKIRFMRSVPIDPMTKQADWGLRSVEDDPDSTSWGGKDVFDVYSRSTETAMDGTKYSDW
ncbi:MAG TPA: type II secretion system protein [Candidatus Eremiobacteraceae bacterium]|nr:type II secretion system protein [Candidatus Eremiobacteraceae bacterium]